MKEFEDRTVAFFRNNYEVLAEELIGRVIQLQGSYKKILLTEVKAYGKIGPGYQAIEAMKPGDLWTYPLRLRRMKQSLIVAYNPQEAASCVRVIRASCYDLTKDEFVPMPREGDVANYLELEDNEISTLKFLDESDVLFLIREKDNAEVATDITPEEANSQLAKLLQQE